MKIGKAEINGRNRSPPSSEDRHFINTLPGEITIAGVFDGHGGLSTVAYTLNNFPLMLEKMVLAANGDPEKIKAELKPLFIQHDKLLASHGYIKYRDTGSTATIAIILPSACIIAHIGDSPACIIDPSSGAVLLSIRPHLPSDPEEERRILRNGGTVSREEGDAPRVDGVLMVSRALGDYSLKFEDPKVPEMEKNWSTDFRVVSDPDVVIFPRPARAVLAIFSDGLVDTQTEDMRTMEDIGLAIHRSLNSPANSGDFQKAAESIIREHTSMYPDPYVGDDITLLLLDISKPFSVANTKKMKRHRRVKKTLKRVEGLKTFTI
jgi:serine/threonine protein phosphatase PrpC